MRPPSRLAATSHRGSDDGAPGSPRMLMDESSPIKRSPSSANMGMAPLGMMPGIPGLPGAGMHSMAQTWHRGMESSGPLLIDSLGLPAIKTQPNITEGDCTASVAPGWHTHMGHEMPRASDNAAALGMGSAAGQRMPPHQLHPTHLPPQNFQASGPPSQAPSLGPNGLQVAQSQDSLSLNGILDNILEGNELEALPTGAEAAALAGAWPNGWPNGAGALGGASSMELAMGFGANRAPVPGLPMDDSWNWPAGEQHDVAWQLAPVPHGFPAGYQAGHHHNQMVMPGAVGGHAPNAMQLQLRMQHLAQENAKLQQQLQQMQNGVAVAGTGSPSMNPATPAIAANAVAAGVSPRQQLAEVKHEYGTRKGSEFGGPSWIPHLKHGDDSSDDGELH